MRSATVFLALAATLASAADKAKSPLEEFNVIAGSVALRERGSWCIGERNTCEALCPGRAKANRCDIDTLDYTCQCNNGTEPGLKYYDSSLYSFVCQEAFKQCSTNNAGDPVELPKCKDDIQSKCGTLSISDLPAEDEGSSGDDSDDSDDSEDQDDSDSDSSDDSSDADSEKSKDGESDKEDDDSGSVGLRPVWGTAAVGAAIGAMAIFL